jgi:hypothetical protein
LGVGREPDDLLNPRLSEMLNVVTALLTVLVSFFLHAAVGRMTLRRST